MTDQNTPPAENLPPDLQHGVLGGELRDPFGTRRLAEVEQVAEADRELLDREDAEMLRKVGAEFREQGDLEAQGTDLAALRAAYPAFNDEKFLGVARECYYLLAKVESLMHPEDAADLMTNDFRTRVQADLQQEMATRTLPLHPDLEIRSIAITGGSVDAGGLQHVTTRVHVSAAQLVSDGRKGVLGDLQHLTDWTEDVDFVRDPHYDASQEDEMHQVAAHDSWMLPHHGWRVADVRRSAG